MPSPRDRDPSPHGPGVHLPPTSVGDVSVFYEQDETLVLMRGEIDVALGEDLEQAGRDTVSRRAPIVVDLSDVTFMDSVGLAFLIRLAAGTRERGTVVTLRGPAESVRELLRLTGSSSLFQVVEADTPAGEAPSGR